MRDVIDPWTAAPDVVLALQQSRMQRFAAPGDLEDGAERLRRRDQVVHSLEVSRRRRRRRALRPA